MKMEAGLLRGWKSHAIRRDHLIRRFTHVSPPGPVRLRAPHQHPSHRTESEREQYQSFRGRRALRAILRECTYLPDPQARRYLTDYTLSRFHSYIFKSWKQRNDAESQANFVNAKLKSAFRFARLLQRANEGETKPLLRVLLMTYGRIGARRRTLLTPLLPRLSRQEALSPKPGPATDLDMQTNAEHNELVEHQDFVSRLQTRNDFRSLHELTPPLKALAQSQKFVAPPDLTRPNPRRLKPDVPELNSYLRPMPKCRVKNLTKKWYASLLDRVLPPLPDDEWERLHRLARGKDLPNLPIARRKQVEAQQKGSSLLELVVSEGKIDQRKLFGNREAHTITPRFMQRLWAQVFGQCPRLDLMADQTEWTVMWGQQALRSLRAPQSLERSAQLFTNEQQTQTGSIT